MSKAEYSGKIATKTFKQIAQERLLKATVIPASGLAKQKQEIVDKANAFTRTAEDESFYAHTEKSVSPNCPTRVGQSVGVDNREPYEERSLET